MLKLTINEKKAINFGESIGRSVKPGTIIALTGDLGAGKTALTKGIARGLGITEEITSPTFTIMNVYDSGRLPLYHFDAYRLESPEDMRALDYEEYFFGGGVAVVEWADLVAELIPADAIRIDISYPEGGDIEERTYICNVDPRDRNDGA